MKKFGPIQYLITLIFVSLLVPLVLCYGYVIVNGISAWYGEARWRTSPLEPATATYLCNSLGLGGEDVCQQSDAYASDFFPLINEYFDGENTDKTKNDVDEILFQFQTHCEDPRVAVESSGPFHCWYDLRGDRAYEFAIFYSLGGRVMNVRWGGGASD